MHALYFFLSPSLLVKWILKPRCENLRMRTRVNLNLGKGAGLIYKQLNTC